MHGWWIFWGLILLVVAVSWSRHGLHDLVALHQRVSARAREREDESRQRVVSQMAKPPARPAGQCIARFRLRPIWSAIEVDYNGALVRLPFAGVDQRPMSQGSVRAIWVDHVNGRETPLLLRTSIGVFYGWMGALDY